MLSMTLTAFPYQRILNLTNRISYGGNIVIYIRMSRYFPNFCDLLNEDALCYLPMILIKDIEIAMQIIESLCS